MKTEWNRGDAEMAIALKRAELNSAMQYRSKYDAEGHNICLALVRFTDGRSDVLAAYSNDSAIPESIRLGLGLIPDVSGKMPEAERFGCAGMAQYHTEPKLLNFLCTTPTIRQSAYQRSLPSHTFYRSVLAGQRQQAVTQAALLKPDIASLTLVTEIDCCATCQAYSISRFKAKFPKTSLHTIQLGKRTAEKVPPKLERVRVTIRK